MQASAALCAWQPIGSDWLTGAEGNAAGAATCKAMTQKPGSTSGAAWATDAIPSRNLIPSRLPFHSYLGREGKGNGIL